MFYIDISRYSQFNSKKWLNFCRKSVFKIKKTYIYIYKVAPAEIEEVLLRHNKIADAAVIGVADKEAGEIPKAFIVKKDESLSAEEVNNFVKSLLCYQFQVKTNNKRF